MKKTETESYFESFKGIVLNSRNDNEKDIKSLKEKGLPEKNGGLTYRVMASKYKIIGVGEIIYNKDYKKQKKIFI